MFLNFIPPKCMEGISLSYTSEWSYVTQQRTP